MVTKSVRSTYTAKSNNEVKAKLKATATETPWIGHAHAAHDQESMTERVMRLQTERAICSSRRRMLSWVFGLFAGVSTAYGMGMLLDLAVVSAITLTGSGFLAMLVYIIGLVLAVYASIQAFSSTFYYVTSPKCTDHLASIDAGLSKVRGWFTPKAKAVPADA